MSNCMKGLTLLSAIACASAAQVDISGPLGSGAFGNSVTVLPNGNIVVIDPNPAFGAPNAGAVYLYSPSGTVISALTGNRADDRVGSGGVSVLSNGHFVISSPFLDAGLAPDVGAVTWASASTGISGIVSQTNSLVGTTTNDRVGDYGVYALPNGNYVVASSAWDDGAAADVGAVTWVDGSSGIAGVVSSSNSLTGTTAGDFGEVYITPLANGNYVVANFLWDNGVVANAGAVTWANGSSMLTGQVSTANSLVGTQAGDQVGSGDVIELVNGNYVVRSPDWRNGSVARAGAVTWARGTAGLTGAVSPANSLVGTTTNDQIGHRGIVALNNGHYVVISPYWDNGITADAGAVTWANGNTGTSGAVSTANSLFGATSGDMVGDAQGSVRALANGNYVVPSAYWDNGATVNAGAVTWANGDGSTQGAVSVSNSLIGSTAHDQVGNGGITALANGHYAFRSPSWDNGVIANAGAVTWANGNTGRTGAVSPANSLVGSTTSDSVGVAGVVALTNGNYVVSSPSWDNGAVSNAGAVTWADGTGGLAGPVTAANSLTGTNSDSIGSRGVVALPNGHYVVASPGWRNMGITNAGAVTWANGNTGMVGAVSPANSLVGTQSSDLVGDNRVAVLSDGNYAVRSPNWDNGAIANVGAVTLARGSVGVSGTVHSGNSMLGSVAGEGGNFPFGYDATRGQLVVGRPRSNRISLFSLPPDPIFANGFD